MEASRGNVIPQEKADRYAKSHTLTNPVGIMPQNLSLESRIWESEALRHHFRLTRCVFPSGRGDHPLQMVTNLHPGD
jgi:hypothetical protein